MARDRAENFSSQLSIAPSLSEFFDASPVPAFALTSDHTVTIWNKACERLTGVPAESVLGTRDHWKAFYREARQLLADHIVDHAGAQALTSYYGDKLRPSSLITGGYEVEDFFGDLGDGAGRWVTFSAAPLHNTKGDVVGAIEILQDITQQKTAELALYKAHDDLEELVEKRTAQLAQVNDRLEDDIRKRETAEAELLRRNAELTELNARLSMAQEQLIQSEKLASIGQLAAGVAHEINNPIGYIFSNFGALENYIARLLEVLDAYEQTESLIASADAVAMLKVIRERIELDYLKEDMPVLLCESREGIVRVRKIVQDLKDFSRVDVHQEWQWTDIHRGIDSTLNIVSNEVKYRADVVKEYGTLPEIECLPSQINQVVMNLVVNAAHAIKDGRGVITIRSGTDGQSVWLEVIDTGCGITKDVLPRIFDPFFTTKPVGSGTGLGLSLSYGIVQKHNGRIEVSSEPGIGTTFRVTLPIRHHNGPDEIQ
jgi:signal transduction histidine kinase